MAKALEELLAGHSRAIATGKSRPQAGERLPTAAVLACTDERVVPQRVFDHPRAPALTLREPRSTAYR